MYKSSHQPIQKAKVSGFPASKVQVLIRFGGSDGLFQLLHPLLVPFSGLECQQFHPKAEVGMLQ